MSSIDLCLDGLERRGFNVWPGFVGPELLHAAITQINENEQQGLFKRAQVGQGALRQERDDIRKDKIQWLSEKPEGAAGELMTRLIELKDHLNTRLFLGLWSFEAHYSLYQPGSFYQRHRDVFSTDDTRVVSVVLYLNEPGWKEEDGGKLVLYPANHAPVEVLPEGGTLVVFLSRDLDHEVTEARRLRRSFTGWFKLRA